MVRFDVIDIRSGADQTLSITMSAQWLSGKLSIANR